MAPAIAILISDHHSNASYLPRTVGWNCMKLTHSVFRHNFFSLELWSEWLSEPTNKRGRALERSEQCGASKWVSSASDRLCSFLIANSLCRPAHTLNISCGLVRAFLKNRTRVRALTDWFKEVRGHQKRFSETKALRELFFKVVFTRP